jgi:hypothetical protein
LHSIIGASVLSRSSFTIDAVISAIACSCYSIRSMFAKKGLAPLRCIAAARVTAHLR